MTTLIRQRSRGFWAVLAVGVLTGAILNGMFRPQFAIADADTNNGDKFAQLTAQVEQLSAALVDTQQALVDSQEELADVQVKLASVDVDETGDVYFTGVNVHIVNGMGATYSTNAKGNLIVGYNESLYGFPQTGSHNIVVGDEHTVTSYGGLVVGYQNEISAPGASVTGGAVNTASGRYSSVSGGLYNTAHAFYSSVSGGFKNHAEADYSSVSGGAANYASGPNSSVSGGLANHAIGNSSSVSGGNVNYAKGEHSSVSGGYDHSVSDFNDWAAGSLFEDF